MPTQDDVMMTTISRANFKTDEDEWAQWPPVCGDTIPIHPEKHDRACHSGHANAPVEVLSRNHPNWPIPK